MLVLMCAVALRVVHFQVAIAITAFVMKNVFFLTTVVMMLLKSAQQVIIIII